MNAGELKEVKAGHTGRGLLVENDGHILTDSEIVKQINEDISSGDKFFIPDRFVVSAVFQKYGIENANKRIYPKEILVPQVERYIAERVNNRCAIGALDHPDSTSLSGHDVSHNIISLEWDNHTLVGEMELHLSPGFRRYGVCSTSGDLVANMLLDGYLIGVSSRGEGNVESKLGKMTVTEYYLLCWDVVLEPSTPNAYIRRERGELRPYIENANPKVGATQLSEKLERIGKIKRILNG